MGVWLPLLLGVIAASSAFLTWCVRQVASRVRLIDVPNSRSSHAVPVPRGGGLGIVVSFTVGALFLATDGRLDWSGIYGVVVPACLVAMVGLADDRWCLSPTIRLVIHVIAAGISLAVLQITSAMHFGVHIERLAWVGPVVAGLFIVWSLNLFNFMDGIDGMAGAEAVFVTAAGAVLMHQHGYTGDAVVLAALLSAACLGFLLWNWPPASIFMGDVGSGFLGFIIALLALLSSTESMAALLMWLVLGAVFLVDASLTLTVRLLKGEPIHKPHRTHAYQLLARRWGSHVKVTRGVIAMNVLWLLPIAWLCLRFPSYSIHLAILAFFPLVVLFTWIGCGRERASV